MRPVRSTSRLAQYASFASDVGFDDESGATGSAHFQVWADGTRVAEIGTVTGADTAKHSTATCPVPASSGPSSQTLARATPPTTPIGQTLASLVTDMEGTTAMTHRSGYTLRTVLLAAVLAATLGAGAGPARPATAAAAAPAPVTHTITFDNYSLMIDGRRTYIWAGEFHYYRLPSPDLWRDVLQKMKAAGFNAASIYFDWAYHSPKPGVYDFTGVRDVDKLLDIANEVGIYVIARPGPYINAEVDGGGFPAWLGTMPGRDRSNDPTYLAAADEWMSRINKILARHQLTNGTGTVILDQIENEFYDGSAQARAYMTHLENLARDDGITVPLTGNNNGTFNSGAGALEIDGPDSYPQGFNCSNPTSWHGVPDISYDHPAGRPLYTPEFQGGSFDPWGGPGYDNCRQLTGPDFESVFYKQNIAVGATLQSFYMVYGGTSWGWQSDPSQVYTSYDYGAPITEGRQLTTKYDQDKLIGYFTQSVAPLTKTDALAVTVPSNPAIVDTARINPDTHTQFHILRHSDATSTATDQTHIAVDLGARGTYTYDDADPALQYSGAWSHVGAEQSYTGGDYKHTESFSNTTGDSVTMPFTGTAIRWISSKDTNHGIADVYLDGTKVASVDGYGASKATQQIFYAASGLSDGPHTLKIVVTGQKNSAATGTFVVVDAVDVPPAGATYYASVPQKPGTFLTFAGRDSKIIVVNYQLGASQLQYSTSEILTNQQINGTDVGVLYGRSGQDGETVLNYKTQPTVTVLAGSVDSTLAGSVDSTYDATSGDLRLNYTHTGLARVLVTGGARPLLLLIGTDQEAAKFWLQQTATGPVLVYGSYLLRTASTGGAGLALTGDTSDPGPIEVWSAPAAAKPHGPAPSGSITWNGKKLLTTSTESGSQLGQLTGAQPITLPALTGWKHAEESPEAQPGFDDSSWPVADKMTSNSTSTPGTLPVLFADDYGFHHGDVWYRGRFRANTATTGITLAALTGRAGVYSAWLNGTFLDSSGDGTHTFVFPIGSLDVGADNEVSVLVENMGHNEDYNAADSNKEARGLTAALIAGSPLTSLTWRIQGSRGGEDLVDPVRGPMNTGGLFGERAGWTLPGYPDHSWQGVTLPTSDTTPGVSWYRTSVALDLPKGQDTSVGLRITDSLSRHYRALIFVNGWQLGRYINDVGPQHLFPIPNGILKTNGTNTIAIAVWNTDGSTGGLGTVSLESLGSHASPLRVAAVKSPQYDHATYAMPAQHEASFTLTAPDTATPGATADVSAAFTLPAGAPPATDVRFGLLVPEGWTATPTSSTVVSRVIGGATATATWRITAPASLATVSQLTGTVDYVQRHVRQSLTDVRNVRALPTPPSGVVWVSSLPFFSATNGWGPVERNTSNGEQAAGDGRPITLNGTVYASGLGTNAVSDVSLYLGGQCTRFTATVGVDDEQGSAGSVTFSVISDGTTLTTTPVLTGDSTSVNLDVNITGTQLLDLLVGDGGNGNGNDHGDWADARVTCN
jgi:beta-galactosidase GanA